MLVFMGIIIAILLVSIYLPDVLDARFVEVLALW